MTGELTDRHRGRSRELQAGHRWGAAGGASALRARARHAGAAAAAPARSARGARAVCGHRHRRSAGVHARSAALAHHVARARRRGAACARPPRAAGSARRELRADRVGRGGLGAVPGRGSTNAPRRFSASARPGLFELHPRGRATIDAGLRRGSAKVVARWKDDAPWLIERPIGRGLPSCSRFPRRPMRAIWRCGPRFSILLEKFVDAARARNGAHRTTVGEAWTFEGAKSVEGHRARQGSIFAVTDEPTGKVRGPGSDRSLRDRARRRQDWCASRRPPSARSICAPARSRPQTNATSLGDIRSRRSISRRTSPSCCWRSWSPSSACASGPQNRHRFGQ